MASDVSSILQLELQTDGENTHTWGIVANRNFETLEHAIAGYSSVAIAGTTTTLTATAFTIGTWHDLNLRFTGTLTANSTVIVPTRKKFYIAENATTGAFSLTVKPSAGTGIVIPQGYRAILICDGTNVTGTVLLPYSANLAALGTSQGTLTSYRETRTSLAAAATTNLDLSTANIFDMTQAVSITSLTFTNVPASGTGYSFTLIRRKDATATARAITWPASVKWAAGIAPALTQTTGAVDAFSFLTTDGGTTWLGFTAGTDIR